MHYCKDFRGSAALMQPACLGTKLVGSRDPTWSTNTVPKFPMMLMIPADQNRNAPRDSAVLSEYKVYFYIFFCRQELYVEVYLHCILRGCPMYTSQVTSVQAPASRILFLPSFLPASRCPLGWTEEKSPVARHACMIAAQYRIRYTHPLHECLCVT